MSTLPNDTLYPFKPCPIYVMYKIVLKMKTSEITQPSQTRLPLAILFSRSKR